MRAQQRERVLRKAIQIVAVAALVGGVLWWSNRPTDGPDEGAPFLEVAMPALSPEEQEGERLFNQNCASCHGADAAGQGGIAPPLINKVYRPRMHADAAFLLAVRNGVRQHHWEFGPMPPVEGVDDAAVTKITAYVRALQRENGIE